MINGVPGNAIDAQSRGADPSGGTNSTAAINQALADAVSAAGLGPVGVYLQPGTYLCHGLVPQTGVRLFGQHRDSVHIVNDGLGATVLAGNAATSHVEIDGIHFISSAQDIFSGASCTRWWVHDCKLEQLSAANYIWNAPTVTLMIECVFERNLQYVNGSTRSVPGWFLSAPNNSQQVNQNVWRDEVWNNIGLDNTQFFMHLQAAGTGGVTTAVNVSNRFENVLCEKPYGGMIWAESAINTVFDQVLSWDTASADGIQQGNSGIYLSKNTNGQACANTSIRDSGRNGVQEFASSAVSDIQLDANCTQTEISNPRGNSGVFIDLGGSALVTLLSLPATFTLRNTSGATYGKSYLNNQGTAAAAPLGSTPTAPASTVSTSLVMMGLGTNTTGTPWAFTPASSGKLLVTVTALFTTATAAVAATIGARYGTGTAPSNGAAVTGTRFGAAGDPSITPGAASRPIPITFTAVLALTPGTAYWFDLALDTASGSDAASVSNVSISIVETS